MALIDRDGTWLRVNRSLCELTGYNEEELLAMTYRITHPDDVEETNRLVKGLLSGRFNSCLQRKRYLRKTVRLPMCGLRFPRSAEKRITRRTASSPTWWI